MKVLGIETSCDETSASIIEFKNNEIQILSNVILSQDIHKIFGGVYPEQAFRKHQENIIEILKQASKDVGIEEIDLIGVTAYPGLVGALASGVAVAKTIAKILSKPVIPVNHLWGHLLVNFKSIKPINRVNTNKKYLGLVISGGHTNTYILENLIPLKIRKLSSTLDDAVGEAFDKAARILNLGFPGGPIIDKLAQNYQQRIKNSKEIKPIFPVPNPRDYNFSYSGLKTALIRYVKKNPSFDLEEVCFHFQYAAIKHIVNKMELILKENRFDGILVGGGVASNSFLRTELAEIQDKYGIEILIPEPVLCTDNAAMIAITSIFIYLSYPNIPEDFDIHPNEEEGLLNWYTG